MHLLWKTMPLVINLILLRTAEGINRRQKLLYWMRKLIFSLKKNVMGTSSLQSLLNTVWLNNIIHFGLRVCTEQRNLRWGDNLSETDSQGKEYLVCSEKQTKSRKGDDPRNVRPAKPRMYENKEIPSKA